MVCTLSVPKRVRFEVFKRDGFRCRYCRSDENELTIDHVTPQILGGSDEPENLVTACRDCNEGKTSATLDSESVADIAGDARRHADLIRSAYAVLREHHTNKAEYVGAFQKIWAPRQADHGWYGTISHWHQMGVPVEVITDAAMIAIGRPKMSDVNRFKYMCAIVWNQVRDISRLTARKVDVEGSFKTTAEADEDFDLGYSVARALYDESWTPPPWLDPTQSWMVGLHDAQEERDA